MRKMKRLDHAANRWHGAESDPCNYCGNVSTDWEHVIPVSYRSPTLVIRSCSECNQLAGDLVFDTLLDKYWHIQKKLRAKYRKFSSREKWSDDDLSEVSYKLRVMVAGAEVMSESVSRRLSWILPTATNSAYEEFMLSLARARSHRKTAATHMDDDA